MKTKAMTMERISIISGSGQAKIICILTPFKSSSHVILVVMGMLRDPEDNNEGKFNDNERGFDKKTCHEHGLPQGMCDAQIDIIQAHQGRADEKPDAGAVSTL